MPSNVAWYALYTKPNFEKVISVSLRGKGYEEFLPVSARDNRKHRNACHTEKPLFPGYIFCRFDFDKRLPILMTPGVLHVVGAGSTAAPVLDSEIHAIRAVVTAGVARTPHPFVETGQHVVIIEGPLNGLRGILLREKSKDRLILSVTLLKRAVAIELDRIAIAPSDPEDFGRQKQKPMAVASTDTQLYRRTS